MEERRCLLSCSGVKQNKKSSSVNRLIHFQDIRETILTMNLELPNLTVNDKAMFKLFMNLRVIYRRWTQQSRHRCIKINLMYMSHDLVISIYILIVAIAIISIAEVLMSRPCQILPKIQNSAKYPSISNLRWDMERNASTTLAVMEHL